MTNALDEIVQRKVDPIVFRDPIAQMVKKAYKEAVQILLTEKRQEIPNKKEDLDLKRGRALEIDELIKEVSQE